MDSSRSEWGLLLFGVYRGCDGQGDCPPKTPKAVSVPVPVRVAFDKKRKMETKPGAELIKVQNGIAITKELEDNCRSSEEVYERVKTMYPPE